MALRPSARVTVVIAESFSKALCPMRVAVLGIEMP